MVADRISDFITQVKNSSAVDKTSVSIPYTKMIAAVADVLVKEGYITEVDTKGKGIKKSLVVTLAYDESGAPKINGVKRVSKLSRRVYTGADEIQPVRSGYGTVILSTPEGILTGDQAREKKVGGEVLFQIW